MVSRALKDKPHFNHSLYKMNAWNITGPSVHICLQNTFQLNPVLVLHT